MISVGIDVSKGKSTVCILKPYGELVRAPYEVEHTETGLSELAEQITCMDEEVKAVMEATGAYCAIPAKMDTEKHQKTE